MRILVVGGTRFVGRHLVAEAVARGHEVTVLHRGIDCSGAPGAEHLHADRDADLGVLAGREWDATVDVCAYWPRQVDHLADALGDRGGRQALISTVSVYDRAAEPGLDEQASLVAPLGLDGDRPEIDAHTYGGLKVGCEQVAQHRYAGELLIIRPTYVVGPYDPTGRFPYWVDRMSRGGTVLAPGSPDAPIQYIDARDLARFVVELLEDGDDDTYHTVSPPPPYSFSDLLTELSRALSPSGTRLEWIPSEWLCQQGLTARDLPLWPESDEPEWALAMDPDRALAAGLRPRPLAESAVDTLAWMGEPSARWDERGLGLPAKREERLLAAWATRLAEPR